VGNVDYSKCLLKRACPQLLGIFYEFVAILITIMVFGNFVNVNGQSGVR